MRKLLWYLLALAVSLPAAAQYPNRSVTLFEGYPPGGLVDIVTRALAEGMKARFEHGLVIVNRGGAAGTVAVSETVRAAPDGYTIVLTPQSALVIASQLNELAFKTPDDYEPIMNVVSYYPMIGVAAESPYRDIRELIADARANPGKLRVGSPGEGTASHINLEELMSKSGAKMIHVPFQGWGQSGPALLGGHIEAVVTQPGEVKPFYDAKRIRLLLTFQPQRNASFPDVPTAKEMGWDVANGVWYLLAAPKGTPPSVIKYIHDAAKAAIEDPAFSTMMSARGVDVDYRPGAALKADLWREYRANTEILRKIGLLKKE